MIKIISLFFFSCLFCFSFAQKGNDLILPDTDSIINRANNLFKDGKINNSNYLLDSLLTITSDYDVKANILIQKVKNNMDYNLMLVDSSLNLIRIDFPKLNDTVIKINYFLQKSIFEVIKGTPVNEQLAFLDSAKVMAEIIKDTLLIHDVYFNLGFSNSANRKFKNAIFFFKKMNEFNINNYSKTIALLNISTAFNNLNELDSSLFYANQALTYCDTNNNVYYQLLLTQTDNYIAEEKYKEAELTLKKILKSKEKLEGDNYLIANTYILLMKVYDRQGKNLELLDIANKGLDFITEKGLVNFEVDFLKAKIMAFLSVGDSNIYKDYERMLSLEQKRYKSENTKVLDDFKEKFSTIENEKALLKSQNENASLQLKQLNLQKYFFLFGSIFVLGLLVFYIFYRRKIVRNKEEIEKLRKQALQLQMNPHFFFNSLNSINNFITLNKKKEATNYLTKFSRLMRLTLENSQSELVSIGRELEFLDNYLSLEQLRKKNFDYSFNISEELNDIKIPSLLFQPIIENSILHGFDNLPHRGKLVISLNKLENNIYVKIQDNGLGANYSKQVKSNGNHKSMATDILKQRLKYYSKGNSEIIYSKGLDGFKTEGTSVSFMLN